MNSLNLRRSLPALGRPARHRNPRHRRYRTRRARPITFLANRRYFPLLKTTRASAVLIEDGISLDRGAGSPPIAALRTSNPYLAFAHAIELFYQPPHYERASTPPRSLRGPRVSPTARTLAPTVSSTIRRD